MAEPSNIGRSIRILTIETDPVIQSGLTVCLQRFPDLQTIAETENFTNAWQILTDLARSGLLNRGEEWVDIDLILLGVPLTSRGEGRSWIEFCQQVKSRFPKLPILLLANPGDRDVISAFQLGIEGCCLRGSSILDLVASIRRIAAGEYSWTGDILPSANLNLTTEPDARELWGDIRTSWRSNGLRQIDATIAEIEAKIDRHNPSLLARAFLIGRKRELNAARWLVAKLLPPANRINGSPLLDTERSSAIVPSQFSLAESTQDRSPVPGIFDRLVTKLQSSLENLTPTTLEIDILRYEKKQELFYLVLRQFEGLVDELRFSQVTIDQLATKDFILQDLWSSITTDFFGRYHTLSTADRHTEIIPRLLQDAPIVKTAILDRIPLWRELLAYLLYKTPLSIDGIIYPAGNPVAEDRACILLENLVIHMANAVMQPLLNHFANLESMKAGFYDRRLLSSREIERFRNDLSWRYRLDRHIDEPKAIFESQYRLFIFTAYGIKRASIYAPRPEELERLNGIPLAVTLSLELRDALSPRLKTLTTFLGSGVVYLLTEIIGRGIGLIGRGIIKGVGNIWQETNRIRK